MGFTQQETPTKYKDVKYQPLERNKSFSVKLKRNLYAFISFLTIASVLSLYINFETTSNQLEKRFHEFDMPLNKSENDAIKHIYFIKTKGCTIPAFHPFDTSILEYIKNASALDCSSEKGPALIESNLTSLWVENKYFKNYNITDESLFKCCYRPFYRQNYTLDNGDDRYKYKGKCIDFSMVAHIEDEFVMVNCNYNGTLVYKDFHAFVPLKENSTGKTASESRDKFNVLMLGIDSVSRLNLFRTMPKTAAFLRKMHAIDLRGYNKVGDNTYPNLVPLLTGYNTTELESLCVSGKRFDNCPIVWKDFKKNGFLTAFVEDAANIGLFNYLKRGFAKTPTDYYYRTFERTAEKEIGHHKLNSHICLGARMTFDVLLNYAYKFVQTLSQKIFFGFFWETSMSHDGLELPQRMDASYSNYLNKLHDGGYLENTILMFLSDHGMRWGAIRQTHQGRLEERLPFFFIVLPEKFKQKYRMAVSNMITNTMRLTTPFDIHATLLDLTALDQIENENIIERSENSSYNNDRGISLFLPINGNRTCEAAGITAHWCTCHEERSLSVDDKMVKSVTEFILEHINNLLKNHTQCSKLSLKTIVEADIYEPSKILDISKNSSFVCDYTVTFETKPGNAIFEATARNKSSEWMMTGTVSRLNQYGNQSHCIDDNLLKLYCFCDV